MESSKTSSHNRSNSFPDKRRVHQSNCEDSPQFKLDTGTVKAASESKKKVSPNTKERNSLRQEILQLDKRLQEQFAVRRTLETAVGSGSSSCNTDETSTPKPATELIKEIAVLELEVGYLEQYLLSLYRKAFDHQTSSVSPTISMHQRPKSPVMTPRRLFVDDAAGDTTTKCHTPKAHHSTSKLLPNTRQHTNALECSGLGLGETLFDSGVHRCHSTLSHVSAYPMQSSLAMDPMFNASLTYHSQPLSMMEYAQNTDSNGASLADHFGTRISDHVQETPNRISEEMVKLMAAIFSKLAEPSSGHNGLSSPNSSSSYMDAFSLNYQCHTWSPSIGKDSSVNIRLDNPFNTEELKEFSGPYGAMVEVSCIHRDGQKLGEVELLLQNFRSLICRMQDIDPRKMTHEEKLAFWINVHNALVMHAFLAYGIPQNNMKKVFLLLKAAYNVGGRTISADMIQSTILGCRMSRPGQWIRMIISPKAKFKFGDVREAYAIEHPEPLLHFALCSGSHSDPAVRVYTAKQVVQELEAAKEEFVGANFGIGKDQKLVLPKLVETYTKDAALCTSAIVEMLPDSVRKIQCDGRKAKKSIEWVPHNFTFRYLIHTELINSTP